MWPSIGQTCSTVSAVYSFAWHIHFLPPEKLLNRSLLSHIGLSRCGRTTQTQANRFHPHTHKRLYKFWCGSALGLVFQAGKHIMHENEAAWGSYIRYISGLWNRMTRHLNVCTLMTSAPQIWLQSPKLAYSILWREQNESMVGYGCGCMIKI